MKSSPGTIIVASTNSSGGITNYTTITSPVSQQQQNPFLSADGNTPNNNNSCNQSALFPQSLSDRGIVLTQQQPHHPAREMMIINCNDMDQHSLRQNNNNTPPNRMTMSVSVTPVQEQQQQLNNNSPTATNTTTILMPIQMTSTNSEQSSGIVSGGGGGLYFDQHGNGHTINTSTNSNSTTANQAIEEIIILNTSSSTSTEQYQSDQVQMHHMQPRSTPVIEVVGGQSYERIIMISSPPSTAKLEASANGQQHLVKNGETIISLVSTTKDSGVAGGAPEMIVFEESNGGHGMDGKITTTTTREGHGLKELDGDDDVFKFVLDEVECREPVQRSTRQLRSRGTKDPMLGSGGLEILMMDSPVAVGVGEKKDNVNSDGVVVETANEGEQEEQDVVTGEEKTKEQIVIGE